MRKAAAITNWLNPFPTEGLGDPAKGFSQDDMRRSRLMVRDAAKAGVSWAALMLAARLAINRNAERKAENASSSLEAAVNAKQPLVSLDTDLSDAAKERSLRQIGVDESAPAVQETSKEVAKEEKKKKTRSKKLQKKAGLADWPWQALKSFGRTDLSSYHIAAVLAAAMAGGAAGWKLADKISDSRTRRKLETQLQTQENALDALRATERAEILKQDKAAADKPDLSLMKGISALYPVYFLGMLALTYRASKGYMDKTDVNRLRLKELAALMKEKAKVEQPPSFVSVGDPTVGALEAAKARTRTPVQLPV